jgi:LmeA-like phospholipid-binding
VNSNHQASGDLGEQAISKLAEVGLSNQFDAVDDINVDIRTAPSKLIQGELESVEISGEGVVMQEVLRMEEVQFKTAEIAINPLSLLFGKIELVQPVSASAQVVLTEADINTAFNSDYIYQKLQNLRISVEGQPITIAADSIEFRLPDVGKVHLKADIAFKQSGEIKRIAFSAVPKVSPDHQRVVLEAVDYEEGEGFSSELTTALLEQTSELLNLRNFDLAGIELYLQDVQIDVGKLTLIGSAEIERFSMTE